MHSKSRSVTAPFVISISLLLILLAGCGVGTRAPNTSAQPPKTVQPSTPPSIQVTATPTSITAGQFTNIQWATKNATSISFNPVLPSDDQQLPLSGTAAISLSQTTTFTATAIGPGGQQSASVTIAVASSLPSLTFTATPLSISPGQSTTLSWLAQNATSLTIDNGVGAVAIPSGSVTVTPGATTAYSAIATGPGGTTTQKVTIVVGSFHLTANPAFIQPGQTSTLSWTSTGTSSISIDHGIGPVAVPSGSMTITPSSSAQYTATATLTNGATETASATVAVSQAGAGLANLKHIVFFVQENRSFDNYFGLLGEYRASQGLPATDIDGLPLNVELKNQNGKLVHPYHESTVCTESPTPHWDASHHDMDGGLMDGFLTSYPYAFKFDSNREFIMGHYDQTDLPYYYELATQFATSDRWFSPIPSGTITNRMYIFSATSSGYTNGPGTKSIGQFKWPTIFDALDNAGIPWKYYYQDNSVFLPEWGTWTKNNGADQGRVRNISEWYNILSSPNADNLLAPVVFIENASQINLDEHPQQNIQLGSANSEHIISALMGSSAWRSSAFILTFDEGGGLYDHVSPFSEVLPDNKSPDAPQFPWTFNQSGFRIPLMVVSPWIKPHFVSHVDRDTTAILKLIETRFGVPPLTARDAAQDDMTEFFDFTSPALATPPALPQQPTNGTCTYTLESDLAQP